MGQNPDGNPKAADAITRFDIPIPSLADQQRIVGIFDEEFAAIAEKDLRNAREVFVNERDTMFAFGGDGWDERPHSELGAVKHGFAFKSEYFADTGDLALLPPGNFYEWGGYRERGDKQKYYRGEIPDGFILHEGDLLVAMTEQAAGLL